MTLREAHAGERLMAFIADLMLWISLVLLLDYACALVLMIEVPTWRAIPGLVLLWHLLWAWIYWTWPLLWPMQASLGQWMVGLQVVDAVSGERLHLRQATRRFVWQLLGQLALGYGAWPLLRRQKLTRYDRQSGSKVVLAASRVAIDQVDR